MGKYHQIVLYGRSTNSNYQIKDLLHIPEIDDPLAVALAHNIHENSEVGVCDAEIIHFFLTQKIFDDTLNVFLDAHYLSNPQD